MTTRSLLLLAPLLLSAVPAGAQTRAAGAARVDAEFARADRNRDGAVSRGELARRVATIRFAGRRVTPAETRALAGRWFALADRDRDGRVDRAEARGLYLRTFARFDSDRDGRINLSEREVAKATLMSESVF